MSDVLGPEDVAVVIPTQNRWHILKRTLDGLRGQTVSGFETIVVVDGGGEDHPELAGATVVMRHSPGVGAARNTGAKSTERRLLLFLGDDTIPLPDLLERHLRRHRQSPGDQVGVLGRVQWHPEVAGGRIQRWLDWSDTQFDYRNILSEEAGWGRFYSSNVSLRRDLFIDVGGFDEDFLFGYEDLDLGFRLNEKGFRLLYEPAARVLHVHHYDLAAMRRRFMLVGGGEFLMVHKHPGFPPHFLTLLMNRRRVAPGSPWPWLVDLVPAGARRLRLAAERRAGSWYAKALTPSFVAGWTAAAEMAELADCPGRPDAGDRVAELFDRTAQTIARGHAFLGEIVTALPEGGRILHYRRGTGSPGLELLAAGFDVAFADMPGAPVEGLRWRLKRRASAAAVYEIGSGHDVPPFGFDLVMALDVLDEASDPLHELDGIERYASVVAVTVSVGPLLRTVLARAGAHLVRHRRVAAGVHVVIYAAPGAARRRPTRRPAGIERRLGPLAPPRPPWVPAALV